MCVKVYHILLGLVSMSAMTNASEDDSDEEQVPVATPTASVELLTGLSVAAKVL